MPWEYRQEDAATVDLAHLGAEGWELCAALGRTLYLKRPAPTLQERITLAQRDQVLASGRPLGGGGSGAASADRPRLLHPGLRAALAAMGHTDLLLVADRGFPIPPGPQRIDLALTDDLPTVLQVLRCVAAEVRIEQLLLAEEAAQVSPGHLTALQALLPSVPRETVPHLHFKAIARSVAAAVRTGDSTPYANVLLAIG